mmetsp:Transcript_4980/g.8206  ORF Transcript_4980/g.8206 Transcript_4980/m.8206 type:complete len:97 (+) Transcript_4980:68-358(+)|eukprot:CAMPEP_0114413160 /NCGR_PEP_ID=MMETSP0103-20121206/709_1 /TAXON_ID=37642 ORGANISM="Paraphysomonas imperforata, Strain PA2" /NCGR_SAMPLE_ID=MMETSP0103 /ASSEMBLY_ACC=CAM_ASM_000201 /LENGTH=96 /DNA_ID=CAMNT_0001581221 /DNA_START=66 /DNA_END=356 /DNA_ORIENTATION=-
MAPPSLLLTPSKRTEFNADRKPGRKLGSDRIVGERIMAQRSRNVIPRKSSRSQQPNGGDRKGMSYYFSCMSAGGGDKMKKSPRIAPVNDENCDSPI